MAALMQVNTYHSRQQAHVMSKTETRRTILQTYELLRRQNVKENRTPILRGNAMGQGSCSGDANRSADKEIARLRKTRRIYQVCLSGLKPPVRRVCYFP